MAGWLPVAVKCLCPWWLSSPQGSSGWKRLSFSFKKGLEGHAAERAAAGAESPERGLGQVRLLWEDLDL